MTIDCRITKCDPALRDAQGVYTGDDWTCCADIGRASGGVLLTKERYRPIEALHVQTLSHLLSCKQRTTSRLLGLEYTPRGPTRRGLRLDSDTDARLRKLEPLGLRDGNMSDASALAPIAPLILHGALGARSSYANGFLHLGHDYCVLCALHARLARARRRAVSPLAGRAVYRADHVAPHRAGVLAILTRHLFIALVLLSAACTADLRPDAMIKEPPGTDASQRGAAALARMAEAHGGVERLKAARVAEIVLSDTWPNPLYRWSSMPWDDDPQTMRLTMLLTRDMARVTFTDGDMRGQQWGIQQWCTWTAAPDKSPVFAKHEDAWFWLPTIQYFIEAPWRLREATTVVHLGQSKRNGVTYERVFLTWGDAAPQDTVDQYIAWIDAESGRLAFLEFTARDVYKFVTGIARYEDYREVSGLWFASTIHIVTDHDDFDDTLHKMELRSITLKPEATDDVVILNPDCRANKEQGGAP